jgi:formate dehydrogenase assembly factor FdhD
MDGTSRQKALRPVDVVRVRGQDATAAADCAVVEEPLEIRLHGQPFAVIMRTPGADRELALGFLLSEQVIASGDDIGVLEHCTDPSADHPENIVNATLVDASALDRLLADRRQVTTSSSCGLCGRRTIESLRADAAPIAASWTIAPADLVPLAVICVQATAIGIQFWAIGMPMTHADMLQTLILELAMALGLAMIGPGAYSVDARLSGRQEIVIPPALGRPLH